MKGKREEGGMGDTEIPKFAQKHRFKILQNPNPKVLLQIFLASKLNPAFVNLNLKVFGSTELICRYVGIATSILMEHL